MTIDEAKKLLPLQLKYPLQDGVIDNLIDIHTMMVIFDLQEEEDVDSKKIDCELLAALIELKERREQEDKEDKERSLEIERDDWEREE